ncbi:hypothetical protein Pst134EA_011750 [Puccinia striiformis f. sp. tritici]|uniref:hypothetical protein n=1 Tax=Puccinia striiformis f. sp. tritici TaxID=168172 RepID=UPI002007848D|nr:hypothetical protein Pst134EA_011750 [Puccinia striiformis f. sp. tritici]KAH9468129.1 hypothetical protein Pst134EA_011750 [Puccinia striiformis f. sp. tritici]
MVFDKEDGYDEIDGYDEDGPIEDDYDEGRSGYKGSVNWPYDSLDQHYQSSNYRDYSWKNSMRIRTNEFQLESSTDMNTKQLDKLKGSDDYILDQIIDLCRSFVRGYQLSKENDDESQPDHHHHLKNWLPS